MVRYCEITTNGRYVNGVRLKEFFLRKPTTFIFQHCVHIFSYICKRSLAVVKRTHPFFGSLNLQWWNHHPKVETSLIHNRKLQGKSIRINQSKVFLSHTVPDSHQVQGVLGSNVASVIWSLLMDTFLDSQLCGRLSSICLSPSCQESHHRVVWPFRTVVFFMASCALMGFSSPHLHHDVRFRLSIGHFKHKDV